MVPEGGAQEGDFLLHVYINLKKESFKMKHLANFYQTWYNEFLL
jgi:hypothetical protein